MTLAINLKLSTFILLKNRGISMWIGMMARKLKWKIEEEESLFISQIWYFLDIVS